jgi:hypothetical protein
VRVKFSPSLHHPKKHLDLKAVVQLIISGNIQDGLQKIQKVCESEHYYFSQWRSIGWPVDTTKGVIESIRRHELFDLNFKGKAVWVLFMMLKYGNQPNPEHYFDGQREILITLSAALLKLLIEFPIYNLCHTILKLLFEKYHVDPELVFETGN